MSRAKYICIGIIAIISVMILAAACESHRGSGQPASEYITSISPEDGATDVDFFSSIVVTFSTQLDETTVNADNVTLTWANGVASVLGDVTYDATERTITFTPRFPLNAETQYVLNISNAVVTKAEGDLQTSFTTTAKSVVYHDAPSVGSTDWQIWNMWNDGTNKEQITDLTTHAVYAGFFSKSWSPGYFYIAFRAENLTNSDWDLFIMRGDGSDLVNVTGSGAGDRVEEYVEWAQDGSKIYFLWRIEGTTNRYNIWSSEPDGTLEQLTDLAAPLSAHRMVLSPDGETLLYLVRDTSSDRKAIYKMDLTQDPPTSEAFSDLSEALSVLRMQYSADGSQIYFTAGDPGSANNANIYVTNSATFDAEALTQVQENQTIKTFAASPSNAEVMYVVTDYDAGPEYSLTRLTLSDMSTEVFNQSTTPILGDIVWSPDGANFAYGRGAAPNTRNLYLRSPELGSLNVTEFSDASGSSYTDGIWSTDGETFMYYYTDGDSGTSRIARSKYDGTEKAELTTSGNARLLDWWRSDFPVSAP